MQFRQYIKQDDHYRTFLASDVQWNPNARDYGFTAETAGLTRTARALMDDCKDFLSVLATFLPHGYLTNKLVSTTTSFEDAFSIIEEHFGLQATQESLLDLESLTKQSGESYRQFYERLLAHVRQHLLATDNVTVDGATVPRGGDKLSVSHMNMVALMWLRKIHPELITLVRTEYSLELRGNTSLAALVPRISVNVDNLLAKYDKVGQVNCVQHDDNLSQAAVNKTFLKRKPRPVNRDPKSPFCPGCYSLGKTTEKNLHFTHSPAECPRSAAFARFVQTEEEISQQLEELEFDDGNYAHENISTNVSKQESKSCNPQVNGNVSETKSCFIQEILHDPEHLKSIVLNLKTKINAINIRKEKSPSLTCVINSFNIICVVDEGSEINCLSYNFAKKANIPIDKVKCSAIGANKSPMNVVGVTKYDIHASVVGTRVPADINLSRMIVIDDLGADALLGMPAKIDNKIVTLTHINQIKFHGTDGNEHKVSYPLHNDDSIELHDVLKVSSPQTIYPEDQLIYKLPNQFYNQKKVSISPRPSNSFWIGSKLLDVSDGCVTLTNNLKYPIHLKRHEHIADIKAVKSTSIKKVLAHSDDYENFEHYENWNFEENFINDVSIDPDDKLNKYWKDKFHDLCVEFTDIINFRPSKYNGWYGEVDNSLDFATQPPPTNKIHMPKYNDKMNHVLADKMDQLEKWGVLAKPEDVGVVPIFVCPSMVVPKENGDFRLVTDFTSLNTHIRKPPALSPSIEETKMQIAKFKYLATLDLANFYYQHGMKKEDIQYLATQHPFKGLRVYTCEPQGIKGASEHAYERLSRVFGDLCQEGKMARQADGLFVGGNTLDELYKNLREVFQRTRNANFTLKPSKIIINPQKIVLFGWLKNKEGWEPTEHTITPLSRAEPPKTVKKLRGFLGAIKQLSPCIENYAAILSPLELVAAGKGSAENIIWTDKLLKDFDKAKQSLQKIRTVYTPTPEDVLHTYSDWSHANGAVGGRLEVHRVKHDGSVDKLHGGFFSARVSHWQQRWLSCDGEALSARLVLQHFKPLLQCSNNTVIHHTDSMPTVQAWRKAKTGALSNSARIAAFLAEISTLNVEFIHTAGVNMNYSDYASRNSSNCQDPKCQICKYLSDFVFTADNVVSSIKIEDIERGNVPMPYTQQAAWRQAQSTDKTLKTLVKLINSGQTPEKRKTCGDFTTLKLLYNIYSKGDLKISSQGLITVTQTQQLGGQNQAIVVPQNLFPGLAHAIHLKTMHASKVQMQKLMSRYFYAVGHQRIISEVVDNCQTCLSLKQLPKELFPETTGDITGFGSHFACDVMVRNTQKILLIREKLTQFTKAQILLNETADNISRAIVTMIADMIPEYGTVIRTDNAPQFQSLNSLSDDPNSWLNKFNIRIDLGETFNHNKNPIAENLVKECHKEINKAGYTNDILDEFQLTQVIRNINSRVRDRGFSAKEMCYMRDQATNKNIVAKDEVLKEAQRKKRLQNHNDPLDALPQFDVGDDVMIKDSLSKLKPREKFVVISPGKNHEETHVVVQKQDKKFNSRKYEIPKHQLLKVPRQAALKARKRISEVAQFCSLQVHDRDVEIKTHAWDNLDDDDETDNIYHSYRIIQPQPPLNETEDTTDTEEPTPDLSNQTNDSDTEEANESFHECDDDLASTPEERLDEIIDDARQFLAVHPRPPLGSILRIDDNDTSRRQSARIATKSQPRNYSEFSKTGRK